MVSKYHLRPIITFPYSNSLQKSKQHNYHFITSAICWESMDTIESEIYNFQMWQSVILTSYYYTEPATMLFFFSREIPSLGCWVCLEAADTQAKDLSAANLLVFLWQRLSHSEWYRAHTLVMLSISAWTHRLKTLNVLDLTAVAPFWFSICTHSGQWEPI